MYREHPLHGTVNFLHRKILVEGSHHLRTLPAGVDVAGREKVQRVVSVPAHQHIVKLRLDLAVAHPAGTDVLLHIGMAGAVQRKVADVPQHIGQRRPPVLRLPDDLPRRCKEHLARFLVHGISQLTDLIRAGRVVVKQQIRPMEPHIVQFPIGRDLVLDLGRQMFQHIGSEPPVCIGRRHLHSSPIFSRS